MHFRALLTVYLPEIQLDPEWEKDISTTLEEVSKLPPGQIIENVLQRINMEGLNCVSNAFGRELTPVIRGVMERFYYETEDKRFLEFEDRTAEYLAEYNKEITCIRLPDGRIVEEHSRPLWGKFIVQDGQVYQKYAGPLHHPKRTKKAKKMKALLNYPRRKLYKSFEDYLDQECYAVLNEETGKYGEWYNPDGVYDWYSIGGRWPDMFLVKNDCTDYSFGESPCFSYKEPSAPEGYMWVACARKRDIQWDLMRSWHNEKATERFHELEVMFQTGATNEKYLKVTENGMQEQKFLKKDWTLFRNKIGAWQERYICKLNQEYIALLNSDATPSEKFWELEKRIKEDKKSPAVQLAMTRSNFIYNIVSLINDGAIVFEDLEEFSDELKENIKYFTERTFE